MNIDRPRLVLALALAAVAAQVHGMEPAAFEQPQEKFSIGEYRVLGNTVLPATEIERTLYPLLGTSKTIADVDAARATLEKYYHDRGYGTVFVDVPEQSVDEGVVRLRVTEGQLVATRVTDAVYFSGRDIRNAVPEASNGKVPHIPTLQAQLAEMNSQTPDRTVMPVLKAGPRPGTVQLTLKVQDELPLHTSVAINDQYTTDTSRLRAQFSIGYDNLFDRLDSISLQYQTAPEEPDEVDVWSASYTARLTEAGTKLAFFAVDSNSNVATAGDGGSAINVIGKGQILGMRFISPLLSTAAASHALIAGFEYKDFKESVFSEDLLLTPISYGNFSVGHASVWRRPQRQWSLNTTANFGIRSVANDPEEYRIKRRKAVPNYFLLRSDASFSTALPWDMTLLLRGAGQYAIDSVISNEQFSIAGADGVRGYLEAEQLSDVGIKTSVELGSPRWKFFAERFAGDVFAFFDYGRLSRLNPLREQDPRTLEYGALLEDPTVTLRSAGAGLHFAAFDHVQGAFTWAYPLVDSGNSNGTEKGDSRIHFSVQASW